MFNSAGRAVQPAFTATANGDSTDKPMRAHASLTKMSAISCHRRTSSKCAYGDSSEKDYQLLTLNIILIPIFMTYVNKCIKVLPLGPYLREINNGRNSP